MADANDFILKKIDQIESRLETHVTKIEQRLDQIVHLMQAVAQLQEKESRNADNIKEVKIQLKDSVDKFDRSLGRIHDRLDKFDESVVAREAECEMRNTVTDARVKEVDEKVSKWMNRGIGLWIGISALVVVLQTIGGLVLTSFKDEYNATKAQLTELQKRQNETDQDINRITSTIRSYHQPK